MLTLIRNKVSGRALDSSRLSTRVPCVMSPPATSVIISFRLTLNVPLTPPSPRPLSPDPASHPPGHPPLRLQYGSPSNILPAGRMILFAFNQAVARLHVPLQSSRRSPIRGGIGYFTHLTFPFLGTLRHIFFPSRFHTQSPSLLPPSAAWLLPG